MKVLVACEESQTVCTGTDKHRPGIRENFAGGLIYGMRLNNNTPDTENRNVFGIFL